MSNILYQDMYNLHQKLSHQWIDRENIISKQEWIAIYKTSSVCECASENGHTISKRRVINAFLKKSLSFLPFFITNFLAEPKQAALQIA